MFWYMRRYLSDRRRIRRSAEDLLGRDWTGIWALVIVTVVAMVWLGAIGIAAGR